MLGTWVNVGGILLGSLLGLFIKRGIPEHINNAVIKAEGVAVFIIGLNGIIAAMFTVDGVKLSDSGALLLLVSLVAGCLVGEFLRIDDRVSRFGKMVEAKSGTSGFSKGFVSASLIFAVGAMSIVGALNDGLYGDSSVLFVKATLDFTTSIVLTAALGFGVAFAAVPVFLVQGTVAMLARFLEPFISQDLLSVFSMVGYALVMIIGFNFLCDTKVKVANYLPALLFPIGYYFIFGA